MHELNLAQSIGEIAIQALRRETGPHEEELRRDGTISPEVQAPSPGPAFRVGKVRVRVGELSGVDPDALTFCFEVVRGEWVETAEAVLEVERRPVRVRCLECGLESDLTPDAPQGSGSCGGCGASRREMVTGCELEVFGVELVERTERAA